MLKTIMLCHGEKTIFPQNLVQWQNHNYTITMDGNLCLVAQ
jgi:hypothetical protein